MWSLVDLDYVIADRSPINHFLKLYLCTKIKKIKIQCNYTQQCPEFGWKEFTVLNVHCKPVA